MFSRKQDIMYREEATSAQNTINRGNVNNKFIDYVLFYFIYKKSDHGGGRE